MKALNVQLQPQRVSELDEAQVVSALASLGASGGLVQGVEIDQGDDDGRYVNLTYVTDDLEAFWSLLRQEGLGSPVFGRTLQQCCIIVCEGQSGWHDYRLLHHFNASEVLDSVV